MPRTAQYIVKASTEAIRKKIKEGTGQPTKEWRVEGVPSLVLFTRKTGGGKFYFIYRLPRQKQQKLEIGEFGPITLADAKSAVLELRAQVARGEDPKQTATGITFRELAEKFLSESQTLKSSTRRTYRYDLQKNAFPGIGHLPATEVKTDHIHRICREIKGRGALIQAQNTKSTIGGVYAWAMREGYVKSNPAKEVPNQARKVPRTRSPTDAEIAKLWHSLDKTKIHLPTKLIVRLGILLAQRRAEIAGMRVSELDLDRGEWRIPGGTYKRGRRQEGRTKNDREQIVHLSSQATTLIEQAMRETRDGDYLFPANSRGKSLPHINPQAVTKSIERLRERFGINDITFHDLRRAAGNWLMDQGYSLEVRMLILNHKGQSVHERHYSNQARMTKQVSEAWQAWADHVEAIVAPREPLEIELSGPKTSRFLAAGSTV